MSIRCWLVVLAGALVPASALAAQDWPQWRGPSRDGVVSSSSTPAVWPTSLRRVWRVEVGEGYSSPIISDGRVYVHARRDPDEIVLAIDLASGKVIWRQSYPAPFTENSYAVEMAKGPHSTPLAAGGRLFTLGASGVLSAWDAANGALLWRHDYSASVDTSKLFCGTAMSPLLEAGALIVHVGSDVHGGRLLALDPATGVERWTWQGAGPGYASPIVIGAAGARHLVTVTATAIIGIDPSSGTLLWSTPFEDEWHENIVTPVWTGTHLVISNTRLGTHAYTLTRATGTWNVARAWTNTDVTMYMSTPVIADGILFAHSNKRKGQFVALDARAGTVRWATTGREGEHASVLLTPAHVLYLTNEAELVVAARSAAAFTEQHRYEVADSHTFAAPVLLADGLLVRDASGLSRLALAR